MSEAPDKYERIIGIVAVIATSIAGNVVVNEKGATRDESVVQSNNDMLRQIVNFQTETAPIVAHLDELSSECRLMARDKARKHVIKKKVEESEDTDNAE
jgi:hypothetical protein